MLARAAAALLKAAAVLSFVALVWWLMVGHTSTEVAIRLTAYSVLGLTLPGLVIWRLATPRRRNLVEDLSAGLLLGSACLILVYLLCGWLGLQRWAWLWAAPVLVLAAVVPGFRRRCLRRVTEPFGVIGSWLVTVALAVPIYAMWRFRGDLSPAPFSDARRHPPDMAFHQALAASAKYDFPLQAPWVNGEPMKYHYFYHQLTAAISWATGIDLTELVFTVGFAPVFLAGTALLIPLAQRLTARARWTGPVAVLVASMGGVLQVYPGVQLPTEQTTTYIWSSPTQNLGGALMVLLAVIGVDLLRRDRNRVTWLCFVLAAAAAAGSKATVLPLVLCGFGLALFVRLLGRRIDRAALIGVLVSAALFVLVVVVVFAGESSGLVVKPWQVFYRLQFYRLINFVPYPGVDNHAVWVTGLVVCLSWTLGTAGLLAALIPTRRWFRDPGVPYLIGIAIAGFAAMLITDQSGNSQLYFHRTAVPVIGVLTAYGIWLAVSKARARVPGVFVLLAMAAGVGASAMARQIVRVTPPFRTPDGRLTGLTGPWLWNAGLVLGAAILLAVLWKLVRRRARIALLLCAAMLASLTGAGLLLPLWNLRHTEAIAVSPPGHTRPVGPSATQAEAARWLRDNSDPHDLVATNAHCVIHYGTVCDARHFWVAALTERHVLVEGWAYTNRANAEVATNGVNPFKLPFWDEQLLADNDAAFTSPELREDLLRKPPYELRAALKKLHDHYHVRWLYADVIYSRIPPELAQFADLRYDGLDAQIYELR